MSIYAHTDKDILENLCFRLKQARRNAQLTQSKLAEISGIQRVQISRIEQGRNFNMTSFIRILRALNKLDQIEYFLQESTEEDLLKLFEK